ncbi:F0F1 ATP synthase subunit A [Candidatus Saccharibacteria bacterium]|nr:F0F1 ATP synthase subunit A [Candidatus Saccharibacteria bacterium]NCS82943.1 F0F1 ATP synthase subunit A [Candidatus Saccharibacteria bacterium]
MTTRVAAADLHISISAQPLFEVFGITITNAVFTGAVGALIVVAILSFVAIKVRRGSHNRFTGLIQWVFEGLLKQIHAVIPDQRVARHITPLAVTIFFVVLVQYWMSVIPGPESLTWNGVPLLRSLTADLNFTLALAVITIVTVQLYAIKHLGVFANAGRYFRNPLKDPIGAFEGVLELIGEASRGAALALRLFGNAFAGEVLLVIIAVLTSYFASVVLPFFMAFELFIGFIQAYVFFMLALIFTALAVSHHDSDEHTHPSDDPISTKVVHQG